MRQYAKHSSKVKDLVEKIRKQNKVAASPY